MILRHRLTAAATPGGPIIPLRHRRSTAPGRWGQPGARVLSAFINEVVAQRLQQQRLLAAEALAGQPSAILTSDATDLARLLDGQADRPRVAVLAG